jgi:hypothetical protein
MNELYIKIPSRPGHHKYKKLEPYEADWRGFPCDGVWIVQTRPGCTSSQCVLKIGELQEAYPFLQMAQNVDDLACFISHWYEEQKQKTGKYENGKLVSYTIPCYTDFARDILKFLATLIKTKKYD